MGLTDSNVIGKVARLLRSVARVQTIGGTQNFRLDEYGHVHTLPLLTPRQVAALSGNYFTLTEPTLGTAVATTTSITGVDVTKPVLTLYNSGLKDIVVDMLKFMIVQVPTSATSWQFWVKQYNGQPRASAGSLLTPTNVNGNNENTTGMVAYLGDVTAAETNLTGRVHSSGAFRGIIPTTFDVMGLEFGGNSPHSALLTSGSARYQENVPPLILAPGFGCSIGMYGASNGAAPSFKLTGGYYEG